MHQTLKSIFWKIFSCSCFACINVIVRYLSGGSPLAIAQPLPIYVIMFWQYLIGALVFLPWLFYQKRIIAITQHRLLNFTRVMLAALSIGMWYFSLRHLPITEVVGLGFVAPIITLIAAMLFLHETLTARRALAIALSLIGGFFILRPDKSFGTIGQYGLYALLPISAASFFAFDKILVRKLLSSGENPESLSIYLLLFIAPVCLIPATYNGWIWPNNTHIYWLLIIGILCALANYAFNKAYELAEVTFLMPFGLAKILISGLLSYLAFFEFPQSSDIWLGITIIGASTLLLGKSSTSSERT